MAATTAAAGVAFTGLESASPVKTLSPAEIKALGLDLVLPIEEIVEARRMRQQLHPDRGGDPEQFQYWKERLDRCGAESVSKVVRLRVARPHLNPRKLSGNQVSQTGL